MLFIMELHLTLTHPRSLLVLNYTKLGTGSALTRSRDILPTPHWSVSCPIPFAIPDITA